MEDNGSVRPFYTPSGVFIEEQFGVKLMFCLSNGHFKEYLLYQPFLVKTDNNPLTYIMTTPNLDATGHRWVSALAKYDFQLEYQKG